MTRDILDYEGNKIGELTLPDDTAEAVWTAKLSAYAKAPPTQEEQMKKALSRAVRDSRDMADNIIECFKRSNLEYFVTSGISNELALLKSMWTHNRLRAMDISVNGLSMTIDLMNLVVSGDLETAYFVLGLITPDDMSQPYHFLSQEKIDELRGMVADKIGV